MTDMTRFRKKVASIHDQASALEAVRCVADGGWGCLVVLDEGGHPAGVITDRDLLLRVVAEERDPRQVRVRDVMSWPAVTLGVDASEEEAVEKMREHGFRRLPVVEKGRLVGMVTLDDLVFAFSRSLLDLGKAAHRQFTSSRQAARVGRQRQDLEEQLKGVRKMIEQTAGPAARSFLVSELDGYRDLVAWTLEEEHETEKGATTAT